MLRFHHKSQSLDAPGFIEIPLTMTSIASIRLGVLLLLFQAIISAAACPSFSGTFVVKELFLYPENLDFDSGHCKVYFGFVQLVQGNIY